MASDLAQARLQAYALEVMQGRPGLLPAVLRGVLGGCANLYEAGLEAYLLAERMGLRRRARLPVPVVSIGNLTVGGTGKTPFTQMLCRALQNQGRRVAVLSRGHGGQGESVRVVSDGSYVLLSAEEAGDEPCLLARSLFGQSGPGVPVLVGKDRRLSGREALRRFGLDALVLDDGFQYWQLARDLDVVLLDARRPFDNGYVLPRGLLREPPRHLSRAQMVVVTRADQLNATERDALQAQIGALAPRAAVFFARHAPTEWVRVPSGETCLLDALRGKSVVALSGIAQPDDFARALADGAGVTVARCLVYSDHARYGAADADAARRALRETGSAALVMTEKDAVKWPPSPDFPAFALRVAMQVEDEARFLAQVTERLFQSPQSGRKT